MPDRRTMEDDPRREDEHRTGHALHVSTLGAPDTGPSDDEPMTSLISGVLGDARHLLAAEIESARLEIKAELRQAKTALIAVAIGGGTFAIGALFLMLMLAHGLTAGTSVPLWGSYGIVGGVLVIIGGALLAAGKLQARDADGWPEESVAQAKQDAKWLKDETRSRISEQSSQERR